jgi:hypothetical protein
LRKRAVKEAGGVVDGDVDNLPARPARAIPAVAGDRVTDAVDSAELLGVDVDELSRMGALVAVVGGWGVEIARRA